MTNPTILYDLAEKMIEVSCASETIFYSQLSKHIDGYITERNLGIPLDEINDICHELNLPMISSVVIKIDTGIPGSGYFELYKRLYGNLLNADKEWRNELQKVYAVKDWTPLLREIGKRRK